jgi:hypothetical protein
MGECCSNQANDEGTTLENVPVNPTPNTDKVEAPLNDGEKELKPPADKAT